MYIKEIYIGSFGPLKERTFTFGEGVNLVEGANESGKSTLCAFIKFIFYGLPAKSRAVLSDRKRYLPFDGSAARGTLTLVNEDGEYVISRTFTPSGRGGSDKVQITRLSDGAEITADPGEYFLNMGEGLFTRSAYVPQLSGGLIEGNEVSSAMENLLYSKDEEIDSAAALKILEKASTALVHKRGSGGRLNEATAALDLLSAKAAVSGRVPAELEQLTAQINTLSETEMENERILKEAEDNVKRYRTAALLADLDRFEADKKALEEESERYRALLPGGKIPEGDDLMELVRLGESIKNGEAELKETENTPLPLPPVGRLEQQGGKDAVKARLAALKGRKTGYILCGGILLAAALCLILFVAFAHLNAALYIGAGVLAVGGAVMTILGVKSGRVLRQQLLALDIADLSRVDELAYKEERDLSEYSVALSRRREGLLLMQTRLQEKVMRATALLNNYGCAYRGAEALMDDAARLSALREKLNAMKMEIENKYRDLQKAGEQLQGADRAALAAELGDDHYEVLGAVDIKESERRVSFGNTSRDTLREKLATLKVQRAGLVREAEEAEAVKSRICALTEEIKVMRRSHAALTMALSALESAAQDVRQQFSPTLAARAAEIMARGTAGKYDRFILSREMDISYMDNQNGGAVRTADYLSVGTKDMAYLCLRLALMEVLCPGREMPMIFDESFAAMDEDRLSAMLTIISERKGQSLVLTSGIREGVLIKKCNRIRL